MPSSTDLDVMDLDSPSIGLPARGDSATEQLPPLTSIVPAIFVPIQEDFTQPLDAPRDRVKRLERILESIETQRKAVKSNMLWLAERERDRILGEARQKAATETAATQQHVVPPDEVERTVSNMNADPEPGTDYDIRDMPPANFNDPVPGLTAHEEAARVVLKLVENTVTQREGYEKHMKDMAAQYQALLDKEKLRVDNAGKKPAERSNTG